MDAKSFLKKASEAHGASGNEYMRVSPIVREAMEGLVDKTIGDALGNVIGVKYGEGPKPRPSVMLAGHMDEVGLMVTKIEEGGFLRLTGIGGVDPRILPGHEVVVHGKRSMSGIVGMKPPHLLSKEERTKAQKMEDLFVDIGMGEEEVKKKVAVGDYVTFKRDVSDLLGDVMCGKSFDDRAGVAVILICMEELKNYRVSADVYGVATTQEELGYRGAIVSAFGISPDVGIAIDVTHAETPGVPDWQIQPMGKGPVLAKGPNIHPKVHSVLKKAAKEIGISVQPDGAPGQTGTDAWGMQTAGPGVATALISIPLRYMHTSVETLSLDDVEKAGKLLARFIAYVDADFVKELRVWS